MDVPHQDIDAIHASFDRSFVLPIDLLDNGTVNASEAGPFVGLTLPVLLESTSIASTKSMMLRFCVRASEAGPFVGLTLPVLLESLKPQFDDHTKGADDHAFVNALGVARALVEAQVNRRAAKHRAEAMVLAAIEQAAEGRILELPMGMPFRAGVEKAGADHLLFVVHPRGDDWTLTTIRTGDDTFEARADLPAAWAGLTDAALEAASGVKGAKFCHNGRFIAVADSRDAILELAHLAVAAAE